MARQVSFNVICADTRLGYHVRVVGSIPSLGAWIPSKGLPLATNALEFPSWRSAACTDVEPTDRVEYKYLICDANGLRVQWEDRENRVMDLQLLIGSDVISSVGTVCMYECFNARGETDSSRFQTTACGRRISIARRPSVNAAHEAVASSHPNSLFTPTIRERPPSTTTFDDTEFFYVPSSPVPRQLSGLAVPGEMSIASAEEAMWAQSSSGGKSPTRAAETGLVREESCSNIFASLSCDEPDFSTSQLSAFERRYVLLGDGPLGEGTFGLVWRCALRSSGARDEEGAKAAKIVRKHRLQPRDLRYLLGDEGEIKIHLRMRHSHIIRLFEYFDEASTVALILEYCAGGDLFDSIVDHAKSFRRGFSDTEAAYVTRHVLSALEYLHSQKVVHRDIKCENVLLAYADVPVRGNLYKLCDLGFATVDLGKGLRERLGSPDTVAPEVVVGSTYSHPSDLWSTGVLIYMMIAARPPFSAPTDSEVLQKVRSGSYSLSGPEWAGASQATKDIIVSLMTVDWKLRPTAAEALKSSWVRSG